MTHIYYGIENEEAQAVLMGCPGREVHFLSQSQLLPAFLTVCNAVRIGYLDVSRISSCHWIFNMKSDSNGDIHLAHIEPKIRSLEPLTYQLIVDLFWCGLD